VWLTKVPLHRAPGDVGGGGTEHETVVGMLNWEGEAPMADLKLLF
jgi:hypothetical protein